MCRIFTRVYSCGHSDPPSIHPCSAASIRGNRPEQHICHRSLEKPLLPSFEDEKCRKCIDRQKLYDKEVQRRSNRVSRAFNAFDMTRVWEGSGGRCTSPGTSPTNTTGFDFLVNRNIDGGSDMKDSSREAGKDSRSGNNKGGRSERKDDATVRCTVRGGQKVWKGYDPDGPRDEDFKAWGFAK